MMWKFLQHFSQHYVLLRLKISIYTVPQKKDHHTAAITLSNLNPFFKILASLKSEGNFLNKDFKKLLHLIYVATL